MEFRGERRRAPVDFRQFSFFPSINDDVFFSRGFPPNLPTRAFHSSEESIYGAAGGATTPSANASEFPSQSLKDNGQVRQTDEGTRTRIDRFPFRSDSNSEIRSETARRTPSETTTSGATSTGNDDRTSSDSIGFTSPKGFGEERLGATSTG